MPGAAGLANENRNVANAIDNESDANAFGTDGADGSQAAGNAVDGGCLADNRDNADGSLQITGAENGSSGAAWRNRLPIQMAQLSQTHCIAR